MLRPRGGQWWLETHSYDSRTGENLREYNDMIRDADLVHRQDKLREFQNLRSRIESSGDVNRIFVTGSLKAIELISGDIGRPSNCKDGLAADSLLYVICLHIDKLEIPYIAEQLSDIVISGTCGSGRVHRLSQIVTCIQIDR